MDLETQTRFWAKVATSPSGCWTWTASHNDAGYAQFGLLDPRTARRRPYRAHRIAYELLVGPIPAGLQLDHLCRNRGCVNPDHLEPVTPKVNTLRGIGGAAERAARTHCPQGHEYTPQNTYVSPRNQRYCKACQSLSRHTDKYRARHAAYERERRACKAHSSERAYATAEESGYRAVAL